MTIDATLAALTAGLDRDEAIARAARPGPWRVERTPAGTPDSCGPAIGDGNLMVPDEIHSSAPCNDHIPGPDTEHVAHFDPKRALCQVEVFQRVLKLHAEAERDSALSDRDAGFEAGVYAALELLASIYTEPTDTETGK